VDSSIFGGFERLAPVLGMREFVHPTPFSDEIYGDKKELTGTKKVGDQDCYKIHVIYSGGRGEAIWYFSKSDFLPRGVERIERGGTGKRGAIIVTLTELKVNERIDASAFEAKIPKAWKKTSEPAP
jgi:outer membrane lipoprotein-sorting protein